MPSNIRLWSGQMTDSLLWLRSFNIILDDSFNDYLNKTNKITSFQLNRTPLHYAMAISDEVAELLQESGADAQAKDVVSKKKMYSYGRWN